jgi:23S rRNA-/tRNA-specific pseudouridylate synthase
MEEFLRSYVAVVGCDGHGLFAVEKGCGVLSHPNGNDDLDRSLLRCPYDQEERCYCPGNGWKIYLLNRLDSPVSGLLLLATNPTVAEAVRASFRDGRVAKKYIALVKGFPRHRSGLWRSRLGKISTGETLKAVVGSGLPAETRYEVVGTFRHWGVTLALLHLFPITGRTHQLRIHCAQNGLPIVGDETYGDGRFNAFLKKNCANFRLFLHSSEISLTYAIGNMETSFHANSAVDFLSKIA